MSNNRASWHHMTHLHSCAASQALLWLCIIIVLSVGDLITCGQLRLTHKFSRCLEFLFHMLKFHKQQGCQNRSDVFSNPNPQILSNIKQKLKAMDCLFSYHYNNDQLLKPVYKTFNHTLLLLGGMQRVLSRNVCTVPQVNYNIKERTVCGDSRVLSLMFSIIIALELWTYTAKLIVIKFNMVAEQDPAFKSNAIH